MIEKNSQEYGQHMVCSQVIFYHSCNQSFGTILAQSVAGTTAGFTDYAYFVIMRKYWSDAPTLEHRVRNRKYQPPFYYKDSIKQAVPLFLKIDTIKMNAFVSLIKINRNKLCAESLHITSGKRNANDQRRNRHIKGKEYGL